MAQPRIQPGQVASVSPLGAQLANAKTTALFKGQQLEVVRIVLAAGKTLREHSAPGEITVLCIEGRIEFTTPHAVQVMAAGDFLYLPPGEPHALLALEDSSVLVTICIAPLSPSQAIGRTA